MTMLNFMLKLASLALAVVQSCTEWMDVRNVRGQVQLYTAAMTVWVCSCALWRVGGANP